MKPKRVRPNANTSPIQCCFVSDVFVVFIIWVFVWTGTGRDKRSYDAERESVESYMGMTIRWRRILKRGRRKGEEERDKKEKQENKS